MGFLIKLRTFSIPFNIHHDSLRVSYLESYVLSIYGWAGGNRFGLRLDDALNIGRWYSKNWELCSMQQFWQYNSQRNMPYWISVSFVINISYSCLERLGIWKLLPQGPAHLSDVFHDGKCCTCAECHPHTEKCTKIHSTHTESVSLKDSIHWSH